MGSSQSSSSSSSNNAASPSGSRSRASTEPTHVTVDSGFLQPQSHIYASSLQEYHQSTVHRLIIERKLAPFYLGLSDFEPEWDGPRIVVALEQAELQATENIRQALTSAMEAAKDAESTQMATPASSKKSKEGAAAAALALAHRTRLVELTKARQAMGGGGLQWTSKDEQAKLYIGKAIECPICFLYYPPPLVHTRCCDQPICTECFVQIKRAEPTATHLESEPAACPFCVESNFGCLYIKPAPRPLESRPRILSSASALSTSSAGTDVPSTPVTPEPKAKSRRKSFAHTEKEVVTTDQIHPDWETKLAAVRATAARRAARRIVFRQVGDRLIPVGITSGRGGDGSTATLSTASLPSGFAAQIAAALESSNNNGRGDGNGGNGNGNGSGSRRSNRRRTEQMTQYLDSMGGGGVDLEELMVLEAMRISLQEDEERQKKEREAKEKEKEEKEAASTLSPGVISPPDSTTKTTTTTRGDLEPIAETSRQGAARLAATAALGEAIRTPITSISLLDPSPSAVTAHLSSFPVLAPAIPPPVAASSTSNSVPPSVASNLEGKQKLPEKERSEEAEAGTAAGKEVENDTEQQGYQPLEDDEEVVPIAGGSSLPRGLVHS